MSTNTIKLDYDNPAAYPPVDELMIALQDEGKEIIKKDKTMVRTYKVMHKFAKSLHLDLVGKKIKGMETNMTRGTRIIISILIMHRRMMDTSSVVAPLQKHYV
jgi:uncharacterized protein YbcI